MIESRLRLLLLQYAEQYENLQFIEGDPSWFMHQVEGNANREATAFIASCLSYGNRKQFMPKIEWIIRQADGNVDQWIRQKRYKEVLPDTSTQCFYRLHTVGDIRQLLDVYTIILEQWDTLGKFVEHHVSQNGAMEALTAITNQFSANKRSSIIPHNTLSPCKRLCMFLRWMVRTNSPVDLGLWADFIDKKTLIMPLDTHVLHQSVRLNLLSRASATMTTAIKLTNKLSEVFPDDPLKGDFALFGYGINHK